jgi:hypothetical protein
LSLPDIATHAICVDLWETLTGILFCGIGELYARYSRVYNAFLREPLLVDFLNAAVLMKNRSIKTNLKTYLWNFIGYVKYLLWPDPIPKPIPKYTIL